MQRRHLGWLVLAALVASAALYGLALYAGLWLPLCITLSDAQRDGWFPQLLEGLGSYECRESTGLPELLRAAALGFLALGVTTTFALITRRPRRPELPIARIVS